MANIIHDATVAKNASGQFELWARYDGDGTQEIRVEANGWSSSHPTVAGTNNEVNWSATITPAPQPNSRFVFFFAGSQKDVIV